MQIATVCIMCTYMAYIICSVMLLVFCETQYYLKDDEAIVLSELKRAINHERGAFHTYLD